jgi:flagellar L-ring protein FlgH
MNGQVLVMANFLKILTALIILMLLSGCVADQRDKKLIKPLEKMAAPYDNGTIFQAGFNERPLYEERRARNVGDGLIMIVAESPAAAKKNASKDKNAAQGDGTADDSSDTERRRHSADDEDLTNISGDALAGNIPMTVIQVRDNGHLFVSGGKKVTVNDEDKYVRITGEVDPAFIAGGNTIQSTLMSDVRIQVDELRIHSDGTASNFSEGQSTFGGLFQSMRP